MVFIAGIAVSLKNGMTVHLSGLTVQNRPEYSISTLHWVVHTMTDRYQKLQFSGATNIDVYNKKIENGLIDKENNNLHKMNELVVIIDGTEELMMHCKIEAEALIERLVRLGRPAGIHLILSVQRPSTDIVKNVIKMNIVSRVAFKVFSKADSRLILDTDGAEKLRGNGDMLFYPMDYETPVHAQGAFVSEEEIRNTVELLLQNNPRVSFTIDSKETELSVDRMDYYGDEQQEHNAGYDELLYEAGKLCIEMGKASSSALQRRMNIGFIRAATIIDQLERFGLVGQQTGAKPREILMDVATFEEMYNRLCLQNGRLQ